MTDASQQPQPPFDEPSVLDYFKSLFRFGGERIAISDEQLAVSEKPEEPQPETFKRSNVQTPFPWRSLLALLFALIGQNTFEPPPTTSPIGVAFYLAGFALLGWAIYRGEWNLAALKPTSEGADLLSYRRIALLFSIPLAFAAFALFRDNLFTATNVILWVLAVISFIFAFWVNDPNRRSSGLAGFFRFNSWTLLLISATALVFFFRFYQPASVPPEPFSDHAEKIFDVYDVSIGQTHIFFPRNTGREALQMYLTAGIIRLFDTGYTHLSLKLGTVLAGLCTLPYLYLLGKELGNRWVGLFAALFAGMAYWPNVIARVGLRFPLYPLFVAPVLYYLIRGLRTSNRNDFILAGLALGIGLHGYTPIRILPLVILVAVGLYMLHVPARRGGEDEAHHSRRLAWMRTLSHLLVLVVVALMVFLPLLRYAMENPEMFGFRAFSRLGTVERPLPGPALVIFLKNLWNALIMYAWSNGNIWVHSVTGRPALDVVSAALYYLGGLLLIVRYLRQRRWQDLFLLLSVPLLMLPSILSLAFPDENPALNRAAGAMVPVFLLVGIAIEGLLSAIRRLAPGKSGLALAWGVALVLVGFASLQNYDLVFNQYRRAYDLSAHNTTEMGQVVREFGLLYGSTETAWVVAYPHWVDTRLVGMNAGDTLRDYAIWPEDLANTLADPRPKLFLVNPLDQTAVDGLIALYPAGSLTTYSSRVERDFLMFVVPPAGSQTSPAP